MKNLEVRAYHLRAELDAIDGRPKWLRALCNQFLELWDFLLDDETHGVCTDEHEILVLVCALSNVVDCVKTLARTYLDTTPPLLKRATAWITRPPTFCGRCKTSMTTVKKCT